MKKLFTLLLAAILTALFAVGCAKPEIQDDSTPGTDSPEEVKTITIGASPAPHAEILEVVKEVLKEKGYELKVVEFVDYIQPNLMLDSGELDANYFQHKPYLDDFNKENNTKIVSLAEIHYEPFGIYPGKTESLDALQDGAQVAVPNDTTNEARALLLLEANGLIRVREGAGLQATINDIIENPKNLDIIEIEAVQLARTLQDVDIAVINGNYAIDAGLNVATDAIGTEDKDSIAAETFANIVAIREGDEAREDLATLVEALQSDEVKKFIEDTYEGAVVPKF